MSAVYLLRECDELNQPPTSSGLYHRHIIDVQGGPLTLLGVTVRAGRYILQARTAQ